MNDIPVVARAHLIFLLDQRQAPRADLCGPSPASI